MRKTVSRQRLAQQAAAVAAKPQLQLADITVEAARATPRSVSVSTKEPPANDDPCCTAAAQ
jgi:hypothetical protein